jgi:hypothetical protein
VTKREALIVKLQKLRALQASTNLHEANAAFSAAERIIQTYRLTEAEIDQAARPESDATPQGELILTWPDFDEPEWLSQLAHFLGSQYQCATLTDYNSPEGVYAVGRPEDIATLKYMLAWLGAEIARLGAIGAEKIRNPRRRKWLEDFGAGALEGIELAFRKASKEARRASSQEAIRKLDGLQKTANRYLEKGFKNDTMTVEVGLDVKNEDAYRRGRRTGADLVGRGRKLPVAGTKQLRG